MLNIPMTESFLFHISMLGVLAVYASHRQLVFMSSFVIDLTDSDLHIDTVEYCILCNSQARDVLMCSAVFHKL